MKLGDWFHSHQILTPELVCVSHELLNQHGIPDLCQC
jgi:hypothetical protein